MEFNKKHFKKTYPNLDQEIQANPNQIQINAIRTDTTTAERASTTKRFDNYIPDAVDYIRRCDNQKQAQEIINYLEKRQEITTQYAQKLRKQLKTKGVRSFGPKKPDDYYSRSE